ncbi:MAG: cell division protein FtsL [Gammaproteobacteria bacterium]|nr:cell division protein FtsL [Gammaproteobacteria bacterium]
MALALIVVMSAIAAVYAKHETRKLFIELQTLTADRDRLEVDWGRLLIEQSTWSNHARVERLAREEMGMIEPAAGRTRVFTK